MVKVSVILPTYNRGHSLPAAMKSVLAQSERDLELIVVDDASGDDTEQIVSRIGDFRVKYIRRPLNGGAAAARNTGLAEARGQYIAFQDSDDLWLPGKLEAQLAKFEQLPKKVGVVTGGKLLYGRDRAGNYGPGLVSYAPDPRGRLALEGDQLGHLLGENRISVQNTLFRRDCYPALKWFDECARANEDWDFAVRLAQFTTIFEDSEPVVIGFVSRDSISTSGRKQTMGELRILKKNRALLHRYPKQYAAMLRNVSRTLFKTRKPRRGLRILVASFAAYPPGIFFFGGLMVRSLRRSSGLLLRKLA